MNLRMNDVSLIAEIARLQAQLAETEAALADAKEAQERLEKMVRQLQREKFAARSEKLSPDQFNLPLEELAIAEGMLAAAREKAEAALRGKTAGAETPPRRKNRDHLPRIERVIEPKNTLCLCGCGEMTKIGEDVAERLDVVPAQLRVLVTRRPRYGCRHCAGAVTQAHAPEHVVPGGLPTEALIAQVIVSKFGDHLPLYRQADIFKRQGIRIDRGTLGNWVGRAAFHLKPVIEHMRQHLRNADRIFVDETRAPVLEPGNGATKSGYFWAVVSDDRGHGGTGPPIVVFHYASGRGGLHARSFLENYRGCYLQSDGYGVYDKLAEIDRPEGRWQLVHCWTHVRRRLVKRFESDGSPIAEERLRQIALLYRIEASVRGQAPEIRLAARRTHAGPIIEKLKPWLEAQLSKVSAKSQLATDIAYTLGLWTGLTCFL
jgi:transposase